MVSGSRATVGGGFTTGRSTNPTTEMTVALSLSAKPLPSLEGHQRRRVRKSWVRRSRASPNEPRTRSKSVRSQFERAASHCLRSLFERFSNGSRTTPERVRQNVRRLSPKWTLERFLERLPNEVTTDPSKTPAFLERLPNALPNVSNLPDPVPFPDQI
jgi:hypothetical protein